MNTESVYTTHLNPPTEPGVSIINLQIEKPYVSSVPSVTQSTKRTFNFNKINTEIASSSENKSRQSVHSNKENEDNSIFNSVPSAPLANVSSERNLSGVPSKPMTRNIEPAKF